jgi:beta-aspartyl-dipeptidase (metallo-type)
MGELDILIAGGKIEAMDEDLNLWKSNDGVEVIGSAGSFVVPGLIDGHVHILGCRYRYA